MGSRLELDALLRTVLNSNKTYFQPPESVKLDYPCIVYKLSDINTLFADNAPFSHQNRYSLTVIDKSPDLAIVDKVKKLPRCAFDRGYTADNLNHYNFNIYF